MAFIFSILVLIATTLFFTAHLKIKRWSEAILAWALVGFACLVFVFTIANQLKGLGSQQVVLGLQAGLLLVSAISWLLAQRPKSFRNLSRYTSWGRSVRSERIVFF